MDAAVAMESFILPKKDRPCVPYNSFQIELPVLDLSPVLALEKLQKDLTAGTVGTSKATSEAIQRFQLQTRMILQDMRGALEKFGLVQIVNHDFPLKYVAETTDIALQFFARPSEEKEKVKFYDRGLGAHLGYFCKKHPYSNEKAERWQEGLSLPVQPVEHLTDTCAALMWPDSPERMKAVSDLYKKQGLAFEALSLRLLELIAQSLNLSDTAYYSKAIVNHASRRAGVRVNHYPECPRPDLTLGCPAHTDPNVITVLHQDGVGGLQFLSEEGEWVGVRPHPGAIIVHVGDFLQAWTNNRLKSVVHRVVTNSEKQRLSVLYYLYPASDALVVPPPELVDAEHPRLYRTFTCADYLKALFSPEYRDDRTRLLPSFLNPVPVVGSS